MQDRIHVLDIGLVKKVYAEVLDREEGQPLLFLGCVLYKKLVDDKECKNCRNYPTCYDYFRAFQEEKEGFKRN